MAGSITDLVTRVTDSSSGRPAVTSLASPKAIAATSATINDGTNWTTESAVYFAIYETTAAGVKIQSTQTDWKATRVGTTLSNLTLTGGTDRAYVSGAIVEQTPTARYAKDNYDWAMAHADQDGTLKAGAVDSTAVLASNVVTASKIDFTTIPYGTFLENNTAGSSLGANGTFKTINLTGLTVGRTYMIIFDSPTLGQSGAGTIGMYMAINGTTIARQTATPSASSFQNPKFNMTGWFTAVATTATLTYVLDSNGLTPSTSNTTQRTLVIALLNPSTGI